MTFPGHLLCYEFYWAQCHFHVMDHVLTQSKYLLKSSKLHPFTLPLPQRLRNVETTDVNATLYNRHVPLGYHPNYYGVFIIALQVSFFPSCNIFGIDCRLCAAEAKENFQENFPISDRYGQMMPTG